MSCGNHHELDCSSALDNLYELLDSEDGPIDRSRIEQHLAECGPCLAEYDVEQIVKAIVARSCCAQAPEMLRAKVLSQVVSMRIRISPQTR
jgi:anti-sigma factor (TIGR02949 family)